MRISNYRSLVGVVAFSLFALGGCVSESSSDDTTDSTTESSTTDSSTDTDTDTSTDTTTDSSTDTTTDTSSDIVLGALDPTMFVDGAFTSNEIVDCTLSDGTETQCYEIVTTGTPAEQTPGPFCPRSTTDNDPADVGIWFDESGTDGIVDLTGNYIMDLAVTYNDSNWKLYDENTLEVFVTETLESCDGAAQPNVEDEFKQHCVECSMDYLADLDVTATYLIPVTPQVADTTGSVSQVGVALNGTELSAPAPVDDILGNYTIAAFDDCGGHINLHQGYHYHAAAGGCAEVGTQDDGHAALLGYALDGYGIYGMRDENGDEATGLDECRGEEDDVRGYHYHAASPGENLFIGCFHGKTVASDTDAGGPPAGGPPNQ
ncbi:YHYH protein [Leucothrix arctica]|uniref:YHYH domain-containing protein n=1 Tax=Leucothrix arctica TaxID=1481894 RepID=A0A317CC67_9GAMM|nr:YHYH protein [Leucothrix arctica]PWQ95701.1 hypothetical protein DKT75_11750 [Leucothrix arctica]